MMVNKKIMCLRCNIPMEDLCVVDTNLGEATKYGFSIMLWGGETREYSYYECPKCGMMELIRVKENV
jgi:DNA-directed RNA polymerase subunit RPC12/RpoP